MAEFCRCFTQTPDLCRHGFLPAVALFVVTFLTPGFVLTPNAAVASSGLNLPSPLRSSQDDSAEIQELRTDDSGTRIANNFLTLANNSWPNVAMGTAELIGSIVLWCVLFGIAGFLISAALYFLLLWRGWVSFKWRYFWVVGWMIPVLFLTCFTAGFAYSGAFYGARRYCVHAIEEDQLIEKASMTMYCAMVMDQAEYQAKGDETILDWLAVVESADEHQMEFDEEFQSIVMEKLDAKLGDREDRTWYESMALNLGATLVDDQIGEWTKDNAIDIRVLIAACLNRDEAEEKFGAVTVENVLAGSAPLFQHGHTLAIGWADTVLKPNIILGIFVGVMIPIGSLAGLHLLIGLIGWITPSRGTPPPPVPPTKPMPEPTLPTANGTTSPVPPIKPSPPTK